MTRDRGRRTHRHRAHRRGPLGAAAIVVTGALLAACSSGGGDSSSDTAAAPSGDRGAVVTALVTDVMGPLLREAGTAADAAANATDAYCAAPSPESRQAALDAVDAAIAAYERLDPVDMGPIMVRRTDGHVSYPVDAERVEELLATGPPTDAESIASRTPSSVRGLTTAEHLLTTEPAPGDDPSRCAYLVAITADAAAAIALVTLDSFEGSAEESAYFDRLSGRSSDAEPPKETIDVIVNMAMAVLDRDASLLADPGDQTEASVRRATAAHLATIRSLWGDGTGGLSALVDADLAQGFAGELDEAHRALEDDAVPTADARAAVEGVRATLGTEVVSALDVVVGFSENDGDS